MRCRDTHIPPRPAVADTSPPEDPRSEPFPPRIRNRSLRPAGRCRWSRPLPTDAGMRPSQLSFNRTPDRLLSAISQRPIRLRGGRTGSVRPPSIERSRRAESRACAYSGGDGGQRYRAVSPSTHVRQTAFLRACCRHDIILKSHLSDHADPIIHSPDSTIVRIRHGNYIISSDGPPGGAVQVPQGLIRANLTSPQPRAFTVIRGKPVLPTKIGGLTSDNSTCGS